MQRSPQEESHKAVRPTKERPSVARAARPCLLPSKMPVMVLLCSFLLYPITALPAGLQPKALTLPPLSQESQPPMLRPLSCWNLLPESLPSFNYLTPLPRYLISLALYITLEQAGCLMEANALRQKLHRLGGVKGTETLIQQLHSLQGDRRKRKSGWVLFSILELLGRRTERSRRAPRSPSTADCIYEKEQQVHNVIQFLPQVGSYYNLGTSFYYAAHNCTALAWERGEEAALDLGHDFLVGLMGITMGPGGLIASAALRPVVKSGVKRLIEYYYSNEGRGSLFPSTNESGQKDWRITTEMGSSWKNDYGVIPTMDSIQHMADEVTEVTSLWNWRPFKSWG